MAEQIDADKLLENALAPKKASGDQGSFEQHPLKDQIDAIRFSASAKAAKKGLGIRHVKLIPPGHD